jgi:L-ascorbate metabolism protein UlaG (beta-lactamase superfamily)
MKITWYGHNCWLVETGEKKFLLDPFLNESPTAPVKAIDVEADYILVSHAHFDHISDAVNIAKRTGATVLSNFEICNWLVNQGVGADKTIGMNLGGGYNLPDARIEYTIAHHSSSFPDGSYAGNPGGFVIGAEDKRVYFACDTAAFLEMRLIGTGGLELAVVPIGDLYTMGPATSLEAIKLLGAERVLPCHYNTWPPIAQDASAWAESVRRHTNSKPVILEPGESLEV